jgi:exodeoxyribonuclease VII small subunit
MSAAKGAKDPNANGERVDQSFDASLARLEAIVAELENGGIALEPAIERYQEGVTLLKTCRGILAGFKQRVEELSASAELETRPYDGDPDDKRPADKRPADRG